MTRKRYFSIFLSVIMAFSAVTAFDLAFTQSSIIAYAAEISAPSVTASNASYKSIKLTWKKVKGATKYIVMRSAKKSSGYKAIKTVTKNTYTDAKATCGKTYYYKVTAVKGSTKKTSKPVKIKCTPAKVSGVKATSTACSDVTISFKKVSGASGYDVSYCSTKAGKYKSVAVIKSTSYTHSIGVGNTGYYKVRAYRTVKGKRVYGAYSSVASATAMSHSYSEWITVSPSTCVAKGIQSSTCAICGDVQYRELPMAASHSYGSYIVEKSPTCGETGTKYTVCSICGDKHYEVMPATGEHSYSFTTTEATCTEEGEIVKTCKVCHKTIATPIKAKGHSYSKITVAPTCTEQGYDKYTCSVCGDTYLENYTNPLGHSFTNYASDNNATCTSNATQTAKCDRCDVTDTKEYPNSMLKHRFDGKTVTNNNGTHNTYCSYGCGIYEEQTCVYATEIVTAPTYTEDGKAVYTCLDCGYSFENAIPAVKCDHNGTTTVVNQREATCKNGYTGDKKCDLCGTIIEGGAIIPASHNYVTTPETCTEPSHRECSVCGVIDMDYTPIPAKGHTVSTNYVVKSVAEADSTEMTHLYFICPECNEEIETDTFCLDITGVTAESLAPYAGIAELSPSGHKITLTATKYIDKFELSGTANDITISVDAFDDAEVKLCGVNITNATASVIDDCIRINDKCTETEPVLDANGNPTYDTEGNPITEKVVPTVSISAKDGTENNLKVTAAGGNAIECSTKLEFKGHGILNMETVSTTIDARAKLYIRNLTMNIKSLTNRGIDTKIEAKNEAGLIIDTDYANISFGANANVIINSADDGIRCKNMVFEALDTSLDDTDTIVSITAGGDAIQLEGKKGLTMNQGYMTLKGTKSAVNEKSNLNTYQAYVTSGRITIV